MGESSLIEAGKGAASREGGRGAPSGEESLVDRLRREFDAPAGLLDPSTASWRARAGLEDSEFPSLDACLTAALGSGLFYHGRAFVWRPGRDHGPWWLCLPVALRNGADLLALVGFADRDECGLDTVRRSARPDDDDVRRWGMPCPERALRAWGQAFADELRGEAFLRVGPAARSDGAERQLVARLIRRMKMSDVPTEFQELSLRAVKGTLGLACAVWIPSNPKEPMTLAGDIEGFDRHDYRSLIPERMEGTVHLSNERHADDLPGLRRYVVVAAETQSTSGWLIAINPVDDRSLGSLEVELLQPIASLIGNQRMNWRNYRELKDMLFGVIRSLTTAIDAKDPYTRGHSQRVARIAVKLAETLGLSAQERNDIYLMGLLHDVGKIGIKDEVLKKKERLTDEEYLEIQRHVEIGVEILSDLKKLQHLLPAVRHHHEAWDGTGYPCGLRGTDIPLEARILAVADSFDAMASNRPYREGLRPTKIDTIFREGAGRQWDPEIVDALFECRHDVAEITDRNGDNSLEKVINGAMKKESGENAARSSLMASKARAVRGA